MEPSQCCVLIPSLSPDRRLTAYARELLDAGFGALVVVNDGSAPEYDPIFEELSREAHCTVLRHEKNRGKGEALRTGMRYIYDRTDFQGLITADSDGQHLIGDTLNLCSLLDGHERQVLLGSRDFVSKDTPIPPRSRTGNRITTAVFRLLYRVYLPDTQTGLRALGRDLIPDMLQISGDRFEYEMNMLIWCAKHQVKLTAVPIRTVYLEENASSHFHPIRDSWRIYRLMLGTFIPYVFAAILSWVVDIGLYHILAEWILPGRVDPDARVPLFNTSLLILIATYGARIVSSAVNFNLNKNMVFAIRDCKGAVSRYIILCIAVALASALAVGALHYLFPQIRSVWFKIPVDLGLFFANYRIQRAWVFRQNGGSKA